MAPSHRAGRAARQPDGRNRSAGPLRATGTLVCAQMQEQAQAVAAAISEHMEDKTLFLALCAVLEVEVYP